jgi:hypothetical protein
MRSRTPPQLLELLEGLGTVELGTQRLTQLNGDSTGDGVELPDFLIEHAHFEPKVALNRVRFGWRLPPPFREWGSLRPIGPRVFDTGY